MKRVLLAMALGVLSAMTYAGDLKFTTQEFKPYSYLDGDKPVGAVTEIVEAVCKKAGIGYKIEVYPWSRAQKLVQDGEAQGIFALLKSPEREQWLNFGESILDSEYVVYVASDDAKEYKTAKDFSGKKIAVYGPSATQTSLEKMAAEAGGIELDVASDDAAGFKKLEAKRIDAVYSNKDVGDALVKDLGLKNVKSSFVHKKNTYYVGLGKKNTDTAADKLFFETLSAMKKSGDIKKILDKYSMKAAP